MVERKYNYEFYLSKSKKLKKFIDSYENKPSTHRAYKLHLTRYFQTQDIKDVDNYVKDTRIMDKKEKIQYLDKLQEDLEIYWKELNQEYQGKTPYVWLSAMKMFLTYNKTFELDDVFIKLQKNGHGNVTITNTKTPTLKQLHKIFSYSDPESKAIFMFQLTSGQRIEQVIQTTFNNIDMDHDCPRVYYPNSKTKKPIKTRITPEAKKALQEYLYQRDKFIETRRLRGANNRKKTIDTKNRVFPMTVGNAEVIWATMCKNAGVYELDPNTKRPCFGTHCLRRYFLSHFKDREWGDYFSGHVTARNREYRQFSDEHLDQVYNDHVSDITIFEKTPDLTDINQEIQDLRNENEKLEHRLNEFTELMREMLQKNDKKNK